MSMCSAFWFASTVVDKAGLVLPVGPDPGLYRGGVERTLHPECPREGAPPYGLFQTRNVGVQVRAPTVPTRVDAGNDRVGLAVDDDPHQH